VIVNDTVALAEKFICGTRPLPKATSSDGLQDHSGHNGVRDEKVQYISA